MINSILRNQIASHDEDIIFLDNPSFDNSIIGISHNNEIIYAYDKMIEEFMRDNQCSFEEAQEFIDYNTIRALPYIQHVIVSYDVLSWVYEN